MHFDRLAVAHFTASLPFADCRPRGDPSQVCMRHEMPIEFRKCPVRPSDGGLRVACVRASVPRRVVASAADPCPRAVRADHAPGQHARRSRRRVSAGDLVSGTDPGVRGWLHGRRALVRRGLRSQPRLGLFEVSLDAALEPLSHPSLFRSNRYGMRTIGRVGGLATNRSGSVLGRRAFSPRRKGAERAAR